MSFWSATLWSEHHWDYISTLFWARILDRIQKGNTLNTLVHRIHHSVASGISCVAATQSMTICLGMKDSLTWLWVAFGSGLCTVGHDLRVVWRSSVSELDSSWKRNQTGQGERVVVSSCPHSGFDSLFFTCEGSWSSQPLEVNAKVWLTVWKSLSDSLSLLLSAMDLSISKQGQNEHTF